MSAKRDFNASITTKGLDKTGITEDITRKLYSRRGRKFMGVVEFVVDETSDKRDGTHKVSIGIADLEILLDDSTFEEHLREIMKTLSYNRALDDGQPQLPGAGATPKLEDVIDGGGRHRPHPFLPVDAADDNGICDVCGTVEATAVHSAQEVLDDPGTEEQDESTDETPHQAGEEPTVAEVVAAQERHLSSVTDPFAATT